MQTGLWATCRRAAHCVRRQDCPATPWRQQCATGRVGDRCPRLCTARERREVQVRETVHSYISLNSEGLINVFSAVTDQRVSLVSVRAAACLPLDMKRSSTGWRETVESESEQHEHCDRTIVL